MCPSGKQTAKPAKTSLGLPHPPQNLEGLEGRVLKGLYWFHWSAHLSLKSQRQKVLGEKLCFNSASETTTHP